MQKLKMQSADITAQNIEKIAALFPNCVTEREHNGKLEQAIDFDLLKQELSRSIVEGKQERYQLNWVGKADATVLANTPINKTLRPCREESVNFDSTENLFIEGDNLDALKLLQETYLGKVKMIYIDPPYNTGKDFIYKDNFAMENGEYQLESGQVDDEGNRLVVNSESNGRFHSDWLSMIYSRLKLARNLLTDDGYICISIDDNEMSNIQKLCNEVFGESNFVSNFIVIRSEGGGLAKRAVIGHDYLLVYAKQINSAIPLGRPKDVRGKIVEKEGEKYWIETDWFREEFGRYGTCHYEDILTWYNSNKKQEIDEGIKQGMYTLIPRNGKHVVGRYRKLAEDTSKFYTIIKHLNKNGIKDLEKLGLNKFFDFPKPISLVMEFILGSTILSKNSNDIILDFFAGSATTAHAVMQLNAEDGGNRKFIMVQIPEKTDEKSEAYKAGYKTIAEISKERIRRAGQKIVQELADNQKSTENLDIGFRVLKIDSSNMADIYYTPQQLQQGDMFNQVEHIKADRSEEDLLFQVLLDWGVDLTLPIEKRVINGKNVFFVDQSVLVACFDKEIDEELIKAITQYQPLRAVFRDDGFINDTTKINAEQLFKQLAPHSELRVI